MLKVYKAESDLSLNIMINGEKLHISFTPQTNKGSVYYTSKKEEQDALENNYYYNKLYYLSDTDEIYKTPKVKKESKPRVNKKETDITVSCMEDAKEYLADRFGVSRTSMKGMDDILKHAKDYKIHFVGPDFE